jgi:hypothetical protein
MTHYDIGGRNFERVRYRNESDNWVPTNAHVMTVASLSASKPARREQSSRDKGHSWEIGSCTHLE